MSSTQALGIMTGVLQSVGYVSVAERRNSRAAAAADHSICEERPWGCAKAARARRRSPRSYFENRREQALVSFLSCSAERYGARKIPCGIFTRSTGKVSAFRTALKRQENLWNYKSNSGHSVHKSHDRFVREDLFSNSRMSAGSHTDVVCRVQSIEGAGKPSGSKGSVEPQNRAETSTEGPNGSRETKEQVLDEAESTPSDLSSEIQSNEQVDSVASASTSDGDRHLDTASGEQQSKSGSPQNGSLPTDSHNQWDETSDEMEKEVTPTEELEDYGAEEDWDEEVKYVSRISVPRQKYISLPKVDLVNALLLFFFPENKDPSKFVQICSYLEILLHVEHKVQLEELRSDYSILHNGQDGPLPEDRSKHVRVSGTTNAAKLGSARTERAKKQDIIGDLADWPLDSPAMEGDSSDQGDELGPMKVLTDLQAKVVDAFEQQLSKNDENAETIEDDSQGPSSHAEAREAAAERFQKNILGLLGRAQFEGISVRDLELTAALNPDYLLTLPVDVDWKRTSSSNVKTFRRGYTTEETKGLLLGAKFDFAQSIVLRQIFELFTGPALRGGRWLSDKWNSLWKDEGGREVAQSVSRWLQEPLQVAKEEKPKSDEELVHDREAQLDMPIWLAARQAVPRYEAVLSSAGSRGVVIRRLLVRMGLLQPDPPSMTLPSFGDESVLEPHLRPRHLSRVSMKDIWEPASKSGGNLFGKISTAFSIFFSAATLQEPAYKEIVLLYNGEDEEDPEDTGLQLQTYKKIPLPDLKIVFPSKKLIYRGLDTLRLDITSIAGLLAFMINYRFDDLSSSPSAFILDVIALSALVVFLTRVIFGYKQVWDRYQLLVNKTLYEKTVARGFGVVQFLLDESEEQEFKEAILVFLLLVHHGKAEGMTKAQLTNSGERFLYYRCQQQVEMPVDSAVATLLKFGLIVGDDKKSAEAAHNVDDLRFKAVPYDEGLRKLEQHWISQPSNIRLWN